MAFSQKCNEPCKCPAGIDVPWTDEWDARLIESLKIACAGRVEPLEMTDFGRKFVPNGSSYLRSATFQRHFTRSLQKYLNNTAYSIDDRIKIAYFTRAMVSYEFSNEMNNYGISTLNRRQIWKFFKFGERKALVPPGLPIEYNVFFKKGQRPFFYDAAAANLNKNRGNAVIMPNGGPQTMHSTVFSNQHRSNVPTSISGIPIEMLPETPNNRVSVVPMANGNYHPTLQNFGPIRNVPVVANGRALQKPYEVHHHQQRMLIQQQIHNGNATLFIDNNRGNVLPAQLKNPFQQFPAHPMFQVNGAQISFSQLQEAFNQIPSNPQHPTIVLPSHANAAGVQQHVQVNGQLVHLSPQVIDGNSFNAGLQSSSGGNAMENYAQVVHPNVHGSSPSVLTNHQSSSEGSLNVSQHSAQWNGRLVNAPPLFLPHIPADVHPSPPVLDWNPINVSTSQQGSSGGPAQFTAVDQSYPVEQEPKRHVEALPAEIPTKPESSGITSIKKESPSAVSIEIQGSSLELPRVNTYHLLFYLCGTLKVINTNRQNYVINEELNKFIYKIEELINYNKKKLEKIMLHTTNGINCIETAFEKIKEKAFLPEPVAEITLLENDAATVSLKKILQKFIDFVSQFSGFALEIQGFLVKLEKIQKEGAMERDGKLVKTRGLVIRMADIPECFAFVMDILEME